MENGFGQKTFQELFVELLSKLSEREQDVLKQRYHLTSDLAETSTLKQIGDVYGITRERVRQIEKEAIRKFVAFAKDQFGRDMDSFEQQYVAFLQKQGGLVCEDYLLENFVKPNHRLDFLHDNAFLFVLENVFDSTDKVTGHDHFYDIWILKNIDLNKVAELIAKLESELTNKNKLYQEREIIDLAKKNLSPELQNQIDKYLSEHADLSLEQVLGSYLKATSKIEKNILNEWGLSHWETVQPRKLADKIQLIFKKEQKPMHFREIADSINQSKFDHKRICPATVHNELIANDGFVLIGRGIYALKNWGYTSGTVAEIIARILSGANRPMTKDEIYEQVLKQRQVNKSTIYLTLINKDKFNKVDDGKFSLIK